MPARTFGFWDRPLVGMQGADVFDGDAKNVHGANSIRPDIQTLAEISSDSSIFTRALSVFASHT